MCLVYGQKLSLIKTGGKEREGKERETEGGKTVCIFSRITN